MAARVVPGSANRSLTAAIAGCLGIEYFGYARQERRIGEGQALGGPGVCRRGVGRRC
jgi:hypothetical protein